MSRRFILSCESTADVPYSYMAERDIPVLFYSYYVDGQEYEDDMLRDPEALPRFYGFLADGKLPSTSQLNEPAYLAFFEEQLQKGDLLHIALGSGMTQSVENAQRAAEALRPKYPDRRIEVIDSYCSSSGYGLLVDGAAELADTGATLDEVVDWTRAHAQRVHHQFYSTDLKYFRRSGRMSGSAAMVAAILDICPIMRLDKAGRIIAYDKVRGKRRAVQVTLDTMAKHAEKGENYDGKCWICHSNCREQAEITKAELVKRFPKARDVRICDIGTIIASHCGPGTVAVFFFGDERPGDAAGGNART